MSAKVRPARASDAPGLYRAWEALRLYNASLDSRIVPSPVSETEFKAGLAEILSNPMSAAFVLAEGAGIAGFASGRIQRNQPDRLPEHHATVGYLYVAPSHRRRGLGRELFLAIAGWAGQRGNVSHVEMPVLASDTEAAAFWRALGFTPFIERLWAPLDGASGPR